MANNPYSSGGYQQDPARHERDHDVRERGSSEGGYYGRSGEYYDFGEYGDRDRPSMARGWSRDQENQGLRNQPNAPHYGRGGSFTTDERDWDRGYGDAGYNAGRGASRDMRSSYAGQRDARYRDVAARGDYSHGRDRDNRDRDAMERDRYRGEQRGFLDRAGDEVASWFGDEQAESRRRADQFRGKGPRNYQRSDTRILEDVNDRLSDDPLLDASDIEVAVSKSEVTLSGHVSSRFDKRRAEDLAERVSGVSHVQNNLRVKSTSEQTTSSAETAPTDPTASRRLM